MARIAVAHTDLTAKGGSEAVAINTLSAFQTEHEVTILTLTDPDVAALNDYLPT